MEGRRRSRLPNQTRLPGGGASQTRTRPGAWTPASYVWHVPESIGTGYRLLVQTDSPEGVVGQTLSASFEITTLSSVPAGTSNTTLFLGVGPNPWTQSTTLRSSPPEAMEARLEISDVRGRLVRALASGRLEAGRHSVDWDGTDAQGAPVAAGAYLYRFSAGTVRASGRLMLVR